MKLNISCSLLVLSHQTIQTLPTFPLSYPPSIILLHNTIFNSYEYISGSIAILTCVVILGDFDKFKESGYSQRESH